MPTLRMWWDENISRTREYYNTMLYREGPDSSSAPRLVGKRHHRPSPGLSIHALHLDVQDWLAIDEKLRLPDAEAERINIPANPSTTGAIAYLSLEELAANKEFMANITELVAQGGHG